MSGGTFDLSWYELLNLGEDIELWLEKHRDEVPPLIRQRMLNLAAEAKVMAAKIKAVDYYCAGDHGEDTFNQAWAEAQGESNA